MSIKVINSDVPRPLANYSEASLASDLVFAAGQLASDFKTGVPAEARKHPNFPFYGSDIKLQTDYILKNMAKTFKAAGTSLDSVVKAQVFLTDLNDFNGFDEVWKQHFKVPPPRTTIGTTGLLVKDTLDRNRLDRHSAEQAGRGRQVRCAQTSGELFRSNAGRRLGICCRPIASDFKTGVPAAGKTSRKFSVLRLRHSIQTEFVLENLKKTFESAGSSLDHVVKAQVFLTNLNDFAGFDQVWKRYFKDTASAHNGWNQRASRPGNIGRDRPYRLRSAFRT